MTEKLFTHENKSGNMFSISGDPWLRCTNIKRKEFSTWNMLGPHTQILSAFLCSINGNGKVVDEVPIANTRKIPINSEPKQVKLFTLFSMIMVISIRIVQCNSVRVYLHTNLTAQRPITNSARVRRKTQNN
jgi:hypothetical protein